MEEEIVGEAVGVAPCPAFLKIIFPACQADVRKIVIKNIAVDGEECRVGKRDFDKRQPDRRATVIQRIVAEERSNLVNRRV